MPNSNFHIFSYVKYEGLNVPWIHDFWLFPWLGTAKFIWFWTQKFYLFFYNKVLNLELFLRKPKWWVLLFQSGWMIKIHTHRYLEPHALTFLHPSWDKYKQAVHRQTRRSSEKTCSKRKAAYSMPHRKPQTDQNTWGKRRSDFALTFRVPQFSRTRQGKVEVSLVRILTQVDDAAQAIGSKYPRGPARSHKRLWFVFLAQCSKHGIVVHLIFLFRFFIFATAQEGCCTHVYNKNSDTVTFPSWRFRKTANSQLWKRELTSS